MNVVAVSKMVEFHSALARVFESQSPPRSSADYHDTPTLGQSGQYFVNAGTRRKGSRSGQIHGMSMFFRVWRPDARDFRPTVAGLSQSGRRDWHFRSELEGVSTRHF
jgi:hypothetical protein